MFWILRLRNQITLKGSISESSPTCVCLDQAGSGALQDENAEPQGNFFHSLHLLYVNENPITLIDFPLVYTSVNGRKIRFQSTLRERMTIKSIFLCYNSKWSYNEGTTCWSFHLHLLCRLLCHQQTTAFMAILQNHWFTKEICVPDDM